VAAFFNATSTAHLALIAKPVRSHDDLATVAAQVERDVIAHYTQRHPGAQSYSSHFYLGRGYHKGNGFYVLLEGFNPDSDAVTDTDLKQALIDTIADVITWRLAKRGEAGAMGILDSISTAIGVSKSFDDDAKEPFPPGQWDFRLQDWQIVDPVFGI
jgi:hypothetical protein